MLRRTAKILALTVALVVVASAAMVVFRAALVEAVVTSQLESLGAPNPRLEVGAFDLDKLVFENVALGREDEITAAKITLSYNRDSIVAGRLTEVRIDGFRLRLDVVNRERPLGSLQPLFRGAPKRVEGGRADGGSAIGLFPETVTLADGKLEVRLPDGPLAADITGDGNLAEGTGTATLSNLDLPYLAMDTADVRLEATPTQLIATAMLKGAEDGLNLDLRVTVASWQEEPTLDLTLKAGVKPAVWRIPPWPAEVGGAAALSLDLNGRIPPMATLFRAAALKNVLDRAGLEGRLHLSATDAAIPRMAEGVSATLDLAASLSNGTIAARVTEESEIAAASLDPQWLDSVGLSAAWRPLLESGVAVHLPAGKKSLRAELEPEAEGAVLSLEGAARTVASGTSLDLDGHGSVSLDESYAPVSLAFPRLDVLAKDIEMSGYRARRVHFAGQVRGPFDDLAGEGQIDGALGAIRIGDTQLGDSSVDMHAAFSWAGNRLELRQEGKGSISLVSFRVADMVRLAQSASLRLTDGTVALDMSDNALKLSYEATLQPDPATVELLRADAPAVAVRIGGGTFRIAGESGVEQAYQGHLKIAGGKMAVPESALAADGIEGSMTIPMPEAGRVAQITDLRLSHTPEPAYFAPLRFAGEINRKRNLLTFGATGRDDQGEEVLRLTGRHDLASGKGAMSATVPGITFGGGGPQPGQLFPVLGSIRSASGGVSGSAEIGWGRGALDSGGKLDLRGLSFNTPYAKVEGLEGNITLDGLFPPSTPPDQTLSAQTVDPAVPLKNVTARLQVEPALPPRLHVQRAQADFAGGQLSLSDTVIDPADRRNEFVIGVDGADLSKLLELLRVEDVSGSGRLTGTIPVSVVDGRPVVDRGRLEAEAPGTLKIRPEAAASALGGAGEQVQLMLSALEDFRYKLLSLSLDMPATDDVTLTVRMEGHNPAVLDGYPFAFNINLSGNFTELIAAVRKGADLSSDLIRPDIR